MVCVAAWRKVESSKQLRWVALILGMFQAMSSSAAIFGWASIVPVLSTFEPFSELPRDERALYLGLVFTIGSVAAFVAPLISGAVLDVYGPRRAVQVGISIYALGFGLLFIGTLTGTDTYPYAFGLIGASATMMAHPLFSLAALFPEMPGLVMALLNGCVDASASVFLCMGAMVDSGVSFPIVLLGYLCGPILVILVLSIVFWPPRSFKSAAERQREEAEAQANDELVSSSAAATVAAASTSKQGGTSSDAKATSPAAQHSGPASKTKPSAPDAVDHSLSASPLTSSTDGAGGDAGGVTTTSSKNSSSGGDDKASDSLYPRLFELEFWMLVLFISQALLRFNTYLGSLDAQIQAMDTDDDTKFALLRAFGIILPIGATGVLPAGLIVDRLGITAAGWCLAVLGIIVNALALIPEPAVQYVTFVCFAIFRAFLFTFFTAIVAEQYGFGLVGRIMGTAGCIGGVVSLLQYPLLSLAFAQTPVSFVAPNAILLGCGVVSLAYPVYLTCRFGAMLPALTQENTAQPPASEEAPRDIELATVRE